MKEDFLYCVERAYPYPIERLWAAWTDAAELEQWYSPTDLSVVPGSVVSDAVVGGWWTVAVDVTWVRFSQFGELPEGQVEQTQQGMESYFDSLGEYLDD